MQSLILIGSRNSNGQTASATNAFIEGQKEEKCKTEKIFLTEKNLQYCRQCNEDGWGKCKVEGYCIIKDDFSDIAEKIYKSESVIFSTPVYFGDLSECMKAFLDRFRRTVMYKTNKDKLNNKPCLGICVAGGRGGGSLSCALNLEKILLTCGFDVIDMIPVRRQNLKEKLTILKSTGKWFSKSI